MTQRLIPGTMIALQAALSRSAVYTSFVERQNGADRARNARKVRKTSRLSKDWEMHEAMTDLTRYGYNFCRAVRTLRIKDEERHWRQRSPAMAAGLTDHLWTWREWFTWLAVQPR